MIAWIWWFISPIVWLVVASILTWMWIRIKDNRERERQAFSHFYNTERYRRDFR